MSRLTRVSSGSDHMTPSRRSGALESELRTHAQQLSMSAAARSRLASSMHSEFLAHAWARPEARVAAPRPRWLPGLRLGVLLLVATLGDIKLCAGLAAFGFGTFVTRSPAILGTPFTLVAAAMIVIGAIELAFAYGMWAGRPWAWPVGMGVETASVVLSVAWLLTGASLPLQGLFAAASAVLIWTLIRHEVRAEFARPVGPISWGATAD